MKRRTALPKSKATNAYDLLSEVRALILEKPKRYNQCWWLSRAGGSSVGATRGFPDCGTVACIAGWVAILKIGDEASTTNAAHVAQDQLGLTREQSDELFRGDAAGTGIFRGPQSWMHARRGAKHIATFQQTYETQLKAKAV